MKKIVLILFFFLSLFSLKAQQIEFQKKFQIPGSKEGYCIQEVKGSCGIIYTGYIIVTESYCLIRTDLHGNILWKQQFNFPRGGFSDYVQSTSDCGFLIAGSALDSNNHKNYVLVKTDANGNLQWTKQYTPAANDLLFDSIYSSGSVYEKVGVKARQTDDNGYIILGQVNSPTSGMMHSQLIKTDNAGSVQWTKYYDGNIFKNSSGYSSHVYDIDLAGKGLSKGFILLCQFIDTTKFQPNGYIVLIRIDNASSVLWSKQYLLQGGANFACVSIKETKDKGFILTGNAMGEEVIAFKTDSMGRSEWFKTYDRGSIDLDFLEGNSVKQTYDGGYIIGCNHFHSSVCFEPVLIKIDPIGNLQWSYGYQRNQPNSRGEACNVIQCSDSGYAFCGTIGNSCPGDVFFVKTDINGYAGCYTSPLAWDIYNKSFPEFIIGDTVLVSVKDTSISPVVQIPNITVTTYCLTATGIDESTGLDGIVISPNPSNSSFTLELSSPMQDAEVIIYDMLGHEQLHKKLTGLKTEIQRGDLSAGVYFARVNCREKIFTRKIMIE